MSKSYKWSEVLTIINGKNVIPNGENCYPEWRKLSSRMEKTVIPNLFRDL